MANITDSELTILKNTLAAVRDALKEDDSALAQQIKTMVVESEQILSGKTEKDTLVMGGSRTMSNAQKTKELLEMFKLDERVR